MRPPTQTGGQGSGWDQELILDRLGEEIERIASRGGAIDYEALGQEFGVGAHAARRVHLAQRALAPLRMLGPKASEPLKSIGGYELTEELGRGSFGIVYRAHKAGSPEQVAVKVIPATGERRRQRFLREANALLRLRHPNVLSVLDAGEERGHMFLVTELVDGKSLGDTLRQGGPLTPERSAEVVRQLALAVAHAHEAAILHRDLKPDNVLLDASGRVLLGDFGLAKDLEADRMTKTGAALGTPGYWSPEQARGEEVTKRSDVYGLGAILHACRTGSPPGQSARPPADRRLDAILARCLELDPLERYPDALAVAEDLTIFLEEPDDAAPNRATLVLAVLAGLLAVGVGVAVTLAATRAGGDRGDETAAVTTSAFGGRLTNQTQERDKWLLEALRAARQGNWKGSERALTHALEFDADHPPIWTQRGRARRELGRYADARADLMRSIQLSPTDPRPWYQLGLMHMEQGDTEEAERAFDQAVKREPPPGKLRSRAFNNRGLCRMRRKAFVEALVDFDQAVLADPQNARALLNQGLAHQGLRNHPAAIGAFSKAVELDPRYVKAIYGRGKSKLELERYAEAIADFTRCLELAPGAAWVYSDRGRAYIFQRQFALALADFNAALQRQPKHPVLHLHRMLVLKALGRYEQALDAGRAGLGCQPSPRVKRSIEGTMGRIEALIQKRQAIPQR